MKKPCPICREYPKYDMFDNLHKLYCIGCKMLFASGCNKTVVTRRWNKLVSWTIAGIKNKE